MWCRDLKPPAHAHRKPTWLVEQQICGNSHVVVTVLLAICHVTTRTHDSSISSLPTLYKPVDNLFKLFNAAERWISLFSFHDSPKDESLRSRVARLAASLRSANTEQQEPTNVIKWTLKFHRAPSHFKLNKIWIFIDLGLSNKREISPCRPRTNFNEVIQLFQWGKLFDMRVS